MTARLAQEPVNVVDCDGGCGTTYTPTAPFNRATQNGARYEAREAGWTVRPGRGPGAKTAPDLCPACSPTKDGAA